MPRTPVSLVTRILSLDTQGDSAVSSSSVITKPVAVVSSIHGASLARTFLLDNFRNITDVSKTNHALFLRSNYVPA
jgi:hypothetical protein